MRATSADAQGLLQAIIARPVDDLPRLVFADWLEENGQSERAEFIRVQVQIDRLDMDTEGGRQLPMGVGREQLFIREHALLSRNEHWDCLPFPSWPVVDARGMRARDHARLFRRGFLHTVRLPLSLWLAHGAALRAGHPIERVEVSDKRPAVCGGRSWCWCPDDHPRRTLGMPSVLPGKIWHRLAGYTSRCRLSTWAYYPTKQDALDALSSACLLWATPVSGKS